MRHRTTPQSRWYCATCGASGWWTPSTHMGLNPLKDHDRPDGRRCPESVPLQHRKTASRQSRIRLPESSVSLAELDDFPRTKAAFQRTRRAIAHFAQGEPNEDWRKDMLKLSRQIDHFCAMSGATTPYVRELETALREAIPVVEARYSNELNTRSSEAREEHRERQRKDWRNL